MEGLWQSHKHQMRSMPRRLFWHYAYPLDSPVKKVNLHSFGFIQIRTLLGENDSHNWNISFRDSPALG